MDRGATHTEKGPRPQRSEDGVARCARDLVAFERAVFARLGLCEERTALRVVCRHEASSGNVECCFQFGQAKRGTGRRAKEEARKKGTTDSHCDRDFMKRVG